MVCKTIEVGSIPTLNSKYECGEMVSCRSPKPLLGVRISPLVPIRMILNEEIFKVNLEFWNIVRIFTELLS
jgi:hypothetical protein